MLRPGGRFVVSVNHPMRWPFPDYPDPEDLQVTSSYFDRTPYVETDDDGATVYVEHHRTVGDWVRAVVGAGLRARGPRRARVDAGPHRRPGGSGPPRAARSSRAR